MDHVDLIAELLIEGQANFSGLFKYYKSIEANPNADDLITLITMLARQYPASLYNAVSDMLPGIKYNILPQLTPEDQVKVMKAFGSVKNNDESYNLHMIELGWSPKVDGPWKFRTSRQLEDAFTAFIDGRWQFDVHSANGMIAANRHLLSGVDDYIKQQFIDLCNDRAKQVAATPDMMSVFRKHLANPHEMDADED